MNFENSPSKENSFKVCVKITGIIQEEFNMQDYIIHIFDVGGQRIAWKNQYINLIMSLAKYFIQH